MAADRSVAIEQVAVVGSLASDEADASPLVDEEAANSDLGSNEAEDNPLASEEESDSSHEVTDAMRAFKEVEVDSFKYQNCLERFGFQWPLTDLDGVSLEDSQRFRDLKLAPWRLNLTALSQKYNLYFVAIQDRIHIIRPRGLKQQLPGDPDLIMHLPRSAEAQIVGGYISHSKPHYVNHLVIGNLGNYEIILLACDDGDVLAYYTMQLNRELQARPNERSYSPESTTLPMFHENVGMSAWGLAIHSKTRLIAVSSNLREVTVFVFGQRDLRWPEDVLSECYVTNQRFPPLLGSVNERLPLKLELIQNSRRVLKLPSTGHNMPSIAFADDLEGHARFVVATDIIGNLWVLNIWETRRIGTEDTQVEHFVESCRSSRMEGEQSMGWGAMVIPLRSFRYCATPGGTFGGSDQVFYLTTCDSTKLPDNALKCCFDITCTLPLVANSSVLHPYLGYRYSGLHPGLEIGLHLLFGLRLWDHYRQTGHYPLPSPEGNTEPKTRFEFLLAVVPILANCLSGSATSCAHISLEKAITRDFTNGQCPDLTLYLNKSQAMFESRHPSRKPHLPDGSAILRTFSHDIELIPPFSSDESLHTVCNGLLVQTMPAGVRLPVTFENMHRLSILHRIDDLGIVIVGSQAGRVALLGLTRLQRKFGACPLVGMRIERILPTKQEEGEGHRPLWGTLVGVAVGPVQGAGVDEQEEVATREESQDPSKLDQRDQEDLRNREDAAEVRRENNFSEWQQREKLDQRVSRRWRLFLHYSNHTILSWELSRDDDSYELAVF